MDDGNEKEPLVPPSPQSSRAENLGGTDYAAQNKREKSLAVAFVRYIGTHTLALPILPSPNWAFSPYTWCYHLGLVQTTL